MSRTSLALVGAAVAVAALAGCSSAAAPATVPPAAGARDTAAACTGVVAMDAVVVTYPGADPDAPPATPDALKEWAAAVTPPFSVVAANIPTELDPHTATLRAAIDQTAQGTSIADDEATTAAAAALDKWAHDTCGFTSLDVTGNGTDLPGVPASLPAGPLALSFGNGGDPAKGGFVLLVAKVRDGASYTLDGIRDGSVDFASVADVVAAVQPGTGAQAGYGTAQLASGKYLVVSPIGSPPAFTGVVAAEFEVS